MDTGRAIYELNTMRVAGLPSDIGQSIDRATVALQSARSAYDFASAKALAQDATRKFEAWQAAGSPKESWANKRVAGPVKVWHVGAGAGGLGFIGILLALFFRKR
jgi:hypothetical protein